MYLESGLVFVDVGHQDADTAVVIEQPAGEGHGLVILDVPLIRARAEIA